MTSGCADPRRTLVKPHGGAGSVAAAPPTVEQEQLPCPRCDSTNTKFCYYNNYNFSQPRHFCKSCRRYWTHGGTLRDIPIGGGSRKTAKRSRTCSSSSTDSNAVVSTSSSRNVTFQANPVMFPSGGTSIGGGHVATVNDVKGSALSLCGSFTSLLNNNAGLTSHGPGGLIGLNGFGLGLGSGFDDVGFAFGRGVWPFSTVDDATAGVGNHGGPAAPLHATWHLDGIENNARFISGDCLSWPDLAISTHGNTLK